MVRIWIGLCSHDSNSVHKIPLGAYSWICLLWSSSTFTGVFLYFIALGLTVWKDMLTVWKDMLTEWKDILTRLERQTTLGSQQWGT